MTDVIAVLNSDSAVKKKKKIKKNLKRTFLVQWTKKQNKTKQQLAIDHLQDLVFVRKKIKYCVYLIY